MPAGSTSTSPATWRSRSRSSDRRRGGRRRRGGPARNGPSSGRPALRDRLFTAERAARRSASSRSRHGSPPRRRCAKVLGAPGLPWVEAEVVSATTTGGRRLVVHGAVARGSSSPGHHPLAPVAVARRRDGDRLRGRPSHEGRPHRRRQVRAAEEPLLAAGVPLMARASTGLAVAVARRLPFVYGARVVLLVGTGNNGADALWAGAWLARAGAAVVAVLRGRPGAGRLRRRCCAAGGRVGTADSIAGADVVVDGLVGIGGRGPLRQAAALAAAANDFVVGGRRAERGRRRHRRGARRARCAPTSP